MAVTGLLLGLWLSGVGEIPGVAWLVGGSGSFSATQTAWGADKVHEISFDDISLDLEKDEPFDPAKLTDRVKELDKEVIRVRGWILPASVFQQKGIRSFVLVRDNMECCFGPGAALDDCIIVEMDPGKSTDFTTRPVAVEGVFTVREFKDPGGKHYAIYHLRGRSVK
jgi:hypothetical protein